MKSSIEKLKWAVPLLFCLGLFQNCGQALPDVTSNNQSSTGSSDSKVFIYTGAVQYFKVPVGCQTAQLKLWGAGGGTGGALTAVTGYARGNGGAGGFIMGEMPVTAGAVLTLMVPGAGISGAASGANGAVREAGGGGFPDGGGRTCTLGGGGGGGARVLSGDKVILVAGGGGSGGERLATDSDSMAGGGAGGDLSGHAGVGSSTAGGGGGGGATVGGVAGTGTNVGFAGSSLAGGKGSGTYGYNGGGGGYFGGGTGGSNFGTAGNLGGAGGGSSFADPTQLNHVYSVGGAGRSAPNTEDPDYILGIGMGTTPSISGGPGLIVVRCK